MKTDEPPPPNGMSKIEYNKLIKVHKKKINMQIEGKGYQAL